MTPLRRRQARRSPFRVLVGPTGGLLDAFYIVQAASEEHIEKINGMLKVAGSTGRAKSSCCCLPGSPSKKKKKEMKEADEDAPLAGSEAERGTQALGT